MPLSKTILCVCPTRVIGTRTLVPAPHPFYAAGCLPSLYLSTIEQTPQTLSNPKRAHWKARSLVAQLRSK